mgnify:CR=1 FL=1
MSANNLQTNRNGSRYFFATSENGEQTLGLQFGSTGGSPNLSTMAVTISGGGGNGVIVNSAPSYQATDYIFAEEGMGVYGSTYFTPSTLATTITGINLTSDRVPGSGVACIEAYGGNGSLGGYEMLSRGVNSALISTTSAATNQWMSTIGRAGATAVLGPTGTFLTGGVQAAALTAFDYPSPAGTGALNVSDLSASAILPRWSIGKFGATPGGNAGSDLAIFSYADNGSFLGNPMTIKRSDAAMAIGNLSSVNTVPYPQNLITVAPVAQAPGGVAVAAATPVSVLSITGITGLLANQYYLTDVNVQLSVTSALAVPAFLDFGVRLGGNGSFSYGNTIFVPVGGIPFNVQISLNQISDMGTATPGLVEVIAYQQNTATGAITVAVSVASGGSSHQFKNLT